MKQIGSTNNRRQRILDAASHLIAHYGFDKTTMDDIAREAGVSKGALYLEWASKDDLLDALLSYQMQRLLDDFLARMEADPQGGQIANLYRHALMALQQNALMAAMYTRDSRVLGDFVRRQDVTRYTNRLMFGKDAIIQMQHAGLLRADIQPDVLVYLFSVIALGFLHVETIIPPAEAPPMPDVAEALTNVIGRGFAAQNGDSEIGKHAMRQFVAFIKQQYEEADQ
jgi:TetR/AcrR family acrAB operon transcriptional repressor